MRVPGSDYRGGSDGAGVARRDAPVPATTLASVTAASANEGDLSIGQALAIERPPAENPLTSIEWAF
jgi:hypothetical protein